MGHHRHEFHELLWVDQGHSRQVVDLHEYHLQPGELLFMPRGCVHWYEGREACFGGMLLFNDEFLTAAQAEGLRFFSLFDPLRSSLRCVPAAAEWASIGRLLAEMQHEQAHPTPVGGAAVLQSLLVAVLHKLEAATGPAARVKNNEPAGISQRFRVLLEAHFRTEHGVGFYAAALGCSPRQLTTALQAATGQPARHLIGERLVLEAKRYLAYTDHRVSEVAYALGFEDPAYFSRLFRQKTGHSAAVFRAHLVETSRKSGNSSNGSGPGGR